MFSGLEMHSNHSFKDNDSAIKLFDSLENFNEIQGFRKVFLIKRPEILVLLNIKL